jgi:hypothetical protein
MGLYGYPQDFDQKYSIWICGMVMKLKSVLSRFDHRCFHFRRVRKVVFLKSTVPKYRIMCSLLPFPLLKSIFFSILSFSLRSFRCSVLTLYNAMVCGVQARVRGYVAGLLQDWGGARTHQHQPQAGAHHPLFHLHLMTKKHSCFEQYYLSPTRIQNNSCPFRPELVVAISLANLNVI